MTDFSTGRFKLEIELGNAAMCLSSDVAYTLNEISSQVFQGVDHNIIRDVNGNTVGAFRIEGRSDE